MHIKAAANRKKSKKILVSKKAAGLYDEKRKEGIDADKVFHGKKPLKDKVEMGKDTGDDPKGGGSGVPFSLKN